MLNTKRQTYKLNKYIFLDRHSCKSKSHIVLTGHILLHISNILENKTRIFWAKNVKTYLDVFSPEILLKPRVKDIFLNK